MGRVVKMEAEISTHRHEVYCKVEEFEHSHIMIARAFHEQNLESSSSAPSHLPMYHGQQDADVHPLLKLENLDDIPYENLRVHHEDIFPAGTQLHLSDLELEPTWAPHQLYPQLISSAVGQSNEFDGLPLLPYTSDPIAVTQSAYPCYEEQGVWLSSPEYGQCRSLTTTEDDEDVVDDKPYARLIYEALMQAPGHRMMLREIYEWFRHNTTKPQESGSNGWQNSIRHNLSMNKAFENDRDSAKGNSRKATSVWILTDEAIKNGVQSTTRYRKTGAGKKPVGGRLPAIKRQRAGAKGGRAARHAAKRKYQDQAAFTDSTATPSPSTASYSDCTDYQSFDFHDPRPTVRSWPMTPVEPNLAPEEANLLRCLSPQSTLGFRAQHMGYGEENVHLQNALLQSMRDQQLEELVRLHVD
ncbi:Fork head domain-containing protein isoform 2 [Cladophialophora immunda]|nr:Fork head domain-containing protein isoform 1 [Cladophialophora immunda]OQV00891.1 Fork head domain-containing protein isoform 2 [Cladophialophora immunda]